MQLPYDSAMPFLSLYTKEMIYISMRSLHSCVHYIIFHNSQYMETSSGSISGWTDKKRWYILICIGIQWNFTALKREGNSDICDIRGHSTEWISQTQKDKYYAQILHNITYMWNLKTLNLGKKLKSSC